MPYFNVAILNKRLFLQKLTALIVATAVLIPFVHFKLHIPATLYVSGLLVLHLVFLYLYFARTSWRKLFRNRAEFILRAGAVGFFIYILTLIRFEGSPVAITGRLLLAMAIHGLILAGMMLVRVELRSDQQSAKTSQ